MIPRNNILAAALALALPLTACGDEPKPTGPSDAAYEIVGKEAVKARLRDPDSAEFTLVRVVRRGETTAICGYVNSKNGLGGMTGPQRFISGGATALEEDFAPGEMDQAWARLC
ncbi:hypothetical protein KOAAANKH_02982 [Brevundimonas sp. NIBR10]|uniref:hypothetical protein n=1 Tax=Brevundimonas sp. NIBR10 TaxID=3015997 RepID=UPI0022F1BAB6|nr:hypothetical protein [Brevundimonas sp. NIBR10]WGM48093.1 hypothetical protein KOAAANKH_02982 [Brevundimonas sp. NIBR10]